MSTVRALWNTKYPESAKAVQRRLQLKAGMPEEQYPIEIRRALYLRYRAGAYESLRHRWHEHMRILHGTHGTFSDWMMGQYVRRTCADETP
jgi:hypothetical protein